MPPNTSSRYKFSLGAFDPNGRRFVTPRERYGYRALADNRVHVVTGGEDLGYLAHLYLSAVSERPSGLWWVIADFQDPPILDPMLPLAPGRQLVIPSVETATFVLSEARRQ